MWLTALTGGVARLTHSCTGALEMAAILSEVRPGGEVIMPSFTFASTVNAFVLRGAVPVFVDIQRDTLNIAPNRIEEAITPLSKAIVVVHYAGVCADMDKIHAIADRYGLIVIEDAAQALYSTYNARPAGPLSAMSCFSFHETKNVVSGEGGAIIVNDEKFVECADVIREKGTNRVAFRQRKVYRYTWIDIGSSYLPSENRSGGPLGPIGGRPGNYVQTIATLGSLSSSICQA
jgi:dTDP-4-amino-4,6-dideoxygalactose transaminase